MVFVRCSPCPAASLAGGSRDASGPAFPSRPGSWGVAKGFACSWGPMHPPNYQKAKSFPCNTPSSQFILILTTA